MNTQKLETAIHEAERFLARAFAALEDCRNDDTARIQKRMFYGNGVVRAACRRSSLDLTRALADLRKSPHE